MGTNYYATISQAGEKQEIHLGKLSAGWRFLIATRQIAFRSFADLSSFVQQPNVQIKDEYGKQVTAKEFLKLVEERQKLKSQINTVNDIYFSKDGYDMLRAEFE